MHLSDITAKELYFIFIIRIVAHYHSKIYLTIEMILDPEQMI